MNDIAHRLRESAKATFYDPLKSELNEAASHIEKLEAALREITSVSKVYVANGEDMAKVLLTLLSSHRKIAIAALEGKDD